MSTPVHPVAPPLTTSDFFEGKHDDRESCLITVWPNPNKTGKFGKH